MKLPNTLDTGYTRLIITEAAKANALRNELAYILATAWIETNFTMLPVAEAYYLQSKYSWSDKRMDDWRKRNLRYYPHYGRGFAQLTWPNNYKRADDELGLDRSLIDNPDRAMEPQIAAQVIVYGMLRGWFTGKKLSDYIDLKHSDYYNARKIVNGMDRAGDFAEAAKAFDKLLLKAGYGVDYPSVEKTLEQRIAELEDRVQRLEAGQFYSA